jgi:mannitol/fructose-specific phosphotransferase system IIA component (Ntr-type)/Kef-type K+ transport system membrane component KefB
MHLPGLLLIALLILAGSVGAWLAEKLRLPALFGQVLAGVILAQSAAGHFLHDSRAAFQPFSTFALSLVAVTIGGHLEFRRLHNAKKRILLISIAQTTLTFWLVFGAFHVINPIGLVGELRLPVHLLLASIATSTSPVSTIHLIRERKAKGLLVKTTLAVLAVNNLITLALFEIIRSFDVNLLTSHRLDWNVLLTAAAGVGLALGIGLLAGWGLVEHCRRHLQKHKQARRDPALVQAELFTAFLVTMFLCDGLCEWITHNSPRQAIAPSPILANMMLGLVLANRSSFKEDLLGLFNVLEHSVFSMFYVLAGAHFQWDAAVSVGWASVLFFGVRTVGKVLGGWIGGVLGGSTRRMAHCIGPMLLSQGAIAVSLVILLEQYEAFAPVASIFTACVLSASVMAELFSAPIIGRVLDQAGESSRDRTRLIEFLQEEFILPRLRARDKNDVIEQMTTFLCHTHTLPTPREEVLRAVFDREALVPTGIGHGIAVPHAIVGEGSGIAGVLALLDPPVDFGAPDEVPARLVLLIATPETQKHRHLEVIAAVTRMLRDVRIRERIFQAQSAEEIHEIIDGEESETFNYFLET